MIERLRDGSWRTADRIRAVATVSLALTALPCSICSRPRMTPTPGDGRWARISPTSGRRAVRWRTRARGVDWTAHYQVQQAAPATPRPFYGWHYPPPFLLLAALLAP